MKFRYKFYSEKEKKKEGGLLAPSLLAAGTVVAAHGAKNIRKGNIIENEELPELLKKVEQRRKDGASKVKSIKDSWLGLGHLRKKAIKKAEEEAAQKVEESMRDVRKASRSAKWSKAKGKGLLGIGLGTAAYGLYRMRKDSKKDD